jgi:hypothetical protein
MFRHFKLRAFMQAKLRQRRKASLFPFQQSGFVERARPPSQIVSSQMTAPATRAQLGFS